MIPFPISEKSPVEHGGPLPSDADCVIIGGGVIGICTALFLAKAGMRLVVLEKGRVAGEQSSRNWGWIRQQGRDPAELPIMIEANRLWRELEPELGEDIGLRQSGLLYLADTDKDLAYFEEFMALAREHGLDTELLGPEGVGKLLPGVKNRWLGGMHTASDMKAEPWLAVPALARLAVRAGAVIVENCAARRLDMAGGKVTGVFTEQGRIAAPSVVLAGGAWSSLFLAAHGVRIPQLSVRASVAATETLPLVYEGGAVDTTGAFRRRADGGYTLAAADFHEFLIGPDAFRHLRKFIPQILANPTANRFFPASPTGYPDAWTTPRRWRADEVSPFERMRVLDPRPAAKALSKVARQFASDHPSLGEVRLASAWAGMIDTMPDVVPVVDHAPSLPGLIVATGMSGHGFGIGPGFGRVIASMVRGEPSGHDLSRFRILRFAKGEKLVTGPSL